MPVFMVCPVQARMPYLLEFLAAVPATVHEEHSGSTLNLRAVPFLPL